MHFDPDAGWGWLCPVFHTQGSKTLFPDLPESDFPATRDREESSPAIAEDVPEMKICRFRYVGILFRRPFPRPRPDDQGSRSIITSKQLA
jgi:hypothetical protein